MTAEKYALWIMPPEGIYRRLKDLIARLGAGYSSPVFEPHITLIGGLKGPEERLLSKAVELASLLHPFTIDLGHVEYRDEYYRSLFITVGISKELLEAHSSAGRLFERQAGNDFMPHLSLMYGDFDETTKEEVVRQTGRDFNLSFQVESLFLFSTAGIPEEWRNIREIRF
jgi:2'-5' RNA ligase